MTKAGSTAEFALGAADIARGAARLLQSLGFATLSEFSLGNGRRVDIAGIERSGGVAFVEVKASPADFRSDRKWPLYLDYCDRLYFAVAVGFPLDLLAQPEALPGRTGIVVADRYGGSVLREPAVVKMNAARRRAETLRFARRAAGRLGRLADSRLDAGETPSSA